MPAIKILKASRKTVITDKSYEAMKSHFGKWVPIVDVGFDRKGQVNNIGFMVYEDVVTMFPYNDPYNCEYELNGLNPAPLDVKLQFVTTCSECGKERTVELTEKEYWKAYWNSLGTSYPPVCSTYICKDCLNKDIGDQEDEIHRMVRESVESMVQIDKDDYDKEFVDSYERGMRYE